MIDPRFTDPETLQLQDCGLRRMALVVGACSSAAVMIVAIAGLVAWGWW